MGWAAQDLGHRGFLQLGGERLIYDALEQAVKAPLRYGEPLHEMLGADEAREYLRFVLQSDGDGTAAGAVANALIRDRVRAELFAHFRSAEQRLLAELRAMPTIIERLARGLFEAVRAGAMLGSEAFACNSTCAKRLESQADDIVRTIRSTVQHIAGTEIFCRCGDR